MSDNLEFYYVVVVGVEGADDAASLGGIGKEEGGNREEVLGYKSRLEIGRQQDRRAVGGGSAGYDEDAAVEGVGGGYFEVVPF